MRHSVEARADRWQRRHTGPWRTVAHDLGPLVVTHRYRRRPRVEWVRMWIALHDLQRGFEREFLPLVPLAKRRLLRLIVARIAAPRRP